MAKLKVFRCSRLKRRKMPLRSGKEYRINLVISNLLLQCFNILFGGGEKKGIAFYVVPCNVDEEWKLFCYVCGINLYASTFVI